MEGPDMLMTPAFDGFSEVCHESITSVGSLSNSDIYWWLTSAVQNLMSCTILAHCCKWGWGCLEPTFSSEKLYFSWFTVLTLQLEGIPKLLHVIDLLETSNGTLLQQILVKSGSSPEWHMHVSMNIGNKNEGSEWLLCSVRNIFGLLNTGVHVEH